MQSKLTVSIHVLGYLLADDLAGIVDNGGRVKLHGFDHVGAHQAHFERKGCHLGWVGSDS